MANSNDLTGRDSLGRDQRNQFEKKLVQQALGITEDEGGNRFQNRHGRRLMQRALRKKERTKLVPREQRHKCGECTACCHTVPVSEIGVLAYQGCPHECATGCSIYKDRPTGCKTWNCQWLGESSWPDEYRPDRCGVVVDILPDTFGLRDSTTGESIELPAMQFWVLPGHEDDWQDPDSPVQDLIHSVTATGVAVLWRYRDPGPLGQGARAFWLGDGAKLGPLGQRFSLDGGVPTRLPSSDRQRTDRAITLMGLRPRP